MGNYGNTLDRWYRRAAVVVWARDRAFAARAEAGPQEALSELHARIGAGDLDGARVAAESLAPFWNKIGSRAGLLGSTVPATRKSRAMIARAWRPGPAARPARPAEAPDRYPRRPGSRTADAAIAYPGRASSAWILLCPRPDSPVPSQRSAS